MSINNYILKSDQIFCTNQQDVINGYIIIHDNKIHAVEKGFIPSSLENQYKVYDLSGKTILLVSLMHTHSLPVGLYDISVSIFQMQKRKKMLLMF